MRPPAEFLNASGWPYSHAHVASIGWTQWPKTNKQTNEVGKETCLRRYRKRGRRGKWDYISTLYKGLKKKEQQKCYHLIPIPTDACLHVHWSHEAIVTEAAILPRNVGTLTTITDIRIVFAFINIWWHKVNIQWKQECLSSVPNTLSPLSSTCQSLEPRLSQSNHSMHMFACSIPAHDLPSGMSAYPSLQLHS